MMAGRRLQALCLVLVLLLSTTAAPASAQADDPKQPSVDNPHMHFWGTSQMDQCWTHFDGEGNDGSSQDGYGEKEFTGNGEQVDVDFTCRIQSGETFKENMYLDANSSIVIELEFQIQHTDCSDTQECQDLTLTLFKGTTPVAMDSFPQIGGSDADENLRWEIPVAENMTSWNKSGEEPTLQIEFSKPGYSDPFSGCVFFLCGGWFRFYYSDNPDNYTVEANFPIVNATGDGSGDGGDNGDGGLGGAVGDSLPGFGLAAGLGALAMAAIASSRRED